MIPILIVLLAQMPIGGVTGLGSASSASWITGATGIFTFHSDTCAGTKFTVAGSNITVTDLGRYVVAGNTQTHVIRLFEHSTLGVLASCTLDTAGATPDTPVYCAITPTVLTAGGTYYVASAETVSGDDYHHNSGWAITTTAVATPVVGIYTGGACIDNMHGSDFSTDTGQDAGVDFKYR